jgi:hypothetical protein
MEEPPLATPISRQFFGLIFLIMPFIKYGSFPPNSHPEFFIIFVVILLYYIIVND